MPDFLGNIQIPDVTPSGVFPIQPEYPYGQAHAPEVATHRFGSRDAKTEQRFLLGDGTARFTIKRSMPPALRTAFVNFWKLNQGPLGQFTYNAPNLDGTTTAYICRFADAALSLESAATMIATVGVTLVGVPASTPTYAVNSTVTRYPSSGLASALLDQEQVLFPLIKITPLEPTAPAIYISDRRVVVGGQTWLPRLLAWDGIQQQLDGGTDQARFTLGNADRVMTALVNDCDLFRARLEFSLFHVNTGTKIDLWAGSVTNWKFDRGPHFQLAASDGAYELSLNYPTRRISRICDKVFNNAASGCPWGGIGNGSSCDKTYRGPNGCLAHAMAPYFRGVESQPQGVSIKDNSTGTWGFARSSVTSTSIVADTVYDQVVPEIWCNIQNPDVSKGLVVNCKIIAGRDESDFYAALGIIGEGPLAELASPSWFSRAPQPGDIPAPGYYPGKDTTLPNGVSVTTPFTLDGQPNHGWPLNGYGLRLAGGYDPTADKFSLGQGGDGVQTYNDVRAAGLAFCEIRRADQKGIQPSAPASHSMQATVRGGMSGLVWSAPGVVAWQNAVNNPVWVLVNIYLRARGLWKASTAEQEAAFDVDAAVEAAAICDLQVTPLFGTSTPEKQYRFAGVIQEEKALRDWLQEICNTFGGYYSFSFGKLKIGVRSNSAVDADGTFTDGNIIFNSLALEPARPAFNHLTMIFGDEEFDFAANSVPFYDEDHAIYLARNNSQLPQFLKRNMNLVGVSTKSQAARLNVLRLREELGGVNRAQWKAARSIAFKTTVLGLGTEIGKVCSLTHEDMPTSPETNVPPEDPNYQEERANYGEFRLQGWRLNQDFSIDLSGRTTHNDMYNLVAGPKPADVAAEPMPVSNQFAPGEPEFHVEAIDGKVQFSRLACPLNSDSATQAFFETFYIDEPTATFGYVSGGINDAESTGPLSIFGPPPPVGGYILIDDEILEVTAVEPQSENWWTVDVKRGALGSTAAAHPRVSGSTQGLDSEWNCRIYLAAGLNFQPGTLMVRDDLAASAMVASYDPATGILITTLPLGTPALGMGVYADPRVWILSKRSDPLVLPYRFFSSPARAGFIHSLHQANAGVALVQMRLETPTGASSGWSRQAFHPPMRTGGGAQLVMPFPNLAIGETNSAFNEIRADEAQMFEASYAEIYQGFEGPLTAPSPPTAATPTGQVGGASITISGTAAADAQIAVSIAGPNALTVPAWNAWEWPGVTTPAAIAASLRDWLNGDPEFAPRFTASSAEGSAVITITDKTGLGGSVTAAASGGITATAQDFVSTLGVQIGRVYWLAYTTDDGNRSYVSAPGPSSGPTGSAGSIIITGIPAPADVRVTGIEIYAADLYGALSYPTARTMRLRTLVTSPRRIGVVTPGTTSFTDTTASSALPGLPQYPGENQPGGGGSVQIIVTKDGIPWFQLFVPAGSARSNEVPGAAIGPIALDAAVNADLVNSTSAQVDLRVVLE